MKNIITGCFLLLFFNCATAQTGSFRVVVERVECVKATADDILERDGKGDEIQVCTIARYLNKRSNINDVNGKYEIVSPYVYGDINTNNWRRPFDGGRIKAGDMSALGGIQSNNMFPYGSAFQRLAAPTTYSLPLIAWSGFLQSKVDSVMIIPFVTEWDNPNEITTDLLNKVGMLLQGAISFDLDPLHVFGTAPYEFTRASSGDKFAYRMLRQLALPSNYYKDDRFYNNKNWFGDPHTRAVGMVRTDNGFQFAPKGLWLNYETATQLIDNDLFGFGKGKFALDYKDAQEIGGGEYRLYITVERNDVNTVKQDNMMLVPQPYIFNNKDDHSNFVDIPGNFKITNVNSGMVLQIAGNGNIAGDKLVQGAYHKTNNEQWKLSVNRFGEYRLQNAASHLYMDISEASNNNGADVIQWEWKNFTAISNNNNQRWLLQPQGDGNFIFFNLNSGKAMEVKGESRATNTPVDQWDNNAARHQLWKIEKV